MAQRIERKISRRLERIDRLERKLDTRKQILAAALEVFGEKGYSATTTHEVADRAHVNEVTLFRHFGCKENLFQEGIARFASQAAIDEEVDKGLTGDLNMDLKHLAKSYLSVCKRCTNFVRMAMMGLPRNPERAKSIGLILTTQSAHLASYLKKMYNEGKIPVSDFDVEAKMFCSILFQYAMTTYVFKHDKQVFGVASGELIDILVSLFVGGLEHVNTEGSV